MFLDLLETTSESDRGWLCPAYVEPVYMRRLVHGYGYSRGILVTGVIGVGTVLDHPVP
jgi:hypothetical protein